MEEQCANQQAVIVKLLEERHGVLQAMAQGSAWREERAEMCTALAQARAELADSTVRIAALEAAAKQNSEESLALRTALLKAQNEVGVLQHAREELAQKRALQDDIVRQQSGGPIERICLLERIRELEREYEQALDLNKRHIEEHSQMRAAAGASEDQFRRSQYEAQSERARVAVLEAALERAKQLVKQQADQIATANINAEQAAVRAEEASRREQAAISALDAVHAERDEATRTRQVLIDQLHTAERLCKIATEQVHEQGCQIAKLEQERSRLLLALKRLSASKIADLKAATRPSSANLSPSAQVARYNSPQLCGAVGQVGARRMRQR